MYTNRFLLIFSYDEKKVPFIDIYIYYTIGKRVSYASRSLRS